MSTVAAYHSLREPQLAPPAMQWRVRRFESGDQAAVWRLYHAGLLNGHIDAHDSPADLMRLPTTYLDEPDDGFWVAEFQGRIIGMIAVQCRQRNVALIRRLRVEPRWRDSDLAQHLIETALHHCRERGHLKVVFDTHFSPDQAHRALARCGFHASRSRAVPGRNRLECYVDLYRRRRAD